jgi:hypothetical protein
MELWEGILPMRIRNVRNHESDYAVMAATLVGGRVQPVNACPTKSMPSQPGSFLVILTLYPHRPPNVIAPSIEISFHVDISFLTLMENVQT